MELVITPVLQLIDNVTKKNTVDEDFYYLKPGLKSSSIDAAFIWLPPLSNIKSSYYSKNQCEDMFNSQAGKNKSYTRIFFEFPLLNA